MNISRIKLIQSLKNLSSGRRWSGGSRLFLKFPLARPLPPDEALVHAWPRVSRGARCVMCCRRSVGASNFLSLSLSKRVPTLLSLLSFITIHVGFS